MESLEQILAEGLGDLKTDLIGSLTQNNRVASGKTISELEVTAIGTVGTLSGPLYITALEEGRKPTSPGAVAGDPTLFQAIQVWCAARGIPAEAACPITKKIHEQGYVGTPGVISTPLGGDNLDRRLGEIGAKLSQLFAQQATDVLAHEFAMI